MSFLDYFQVESKNYRLDSLGRLTTYEVPFYLSMDIVLLRGCEVERTIVEGSDSWT